MAYSFLIYSLQIRYKHAAPVDCQAGDVWPWSSEQESGFDSWSLHGDMFESPATCDCLMHYSLKTTLAQGM